MLKAVIVDDEQLAIDALCWELKTHCPNIEIISTITNAEKAVTSINKLKPDVVFLDIEMPTLTGFEVIDKILNKDFDIIFTTGHDEYALKAFKTNAVDYLLKPIDKDELCSAVSRVTDNKEQERLGENLRSFLEQNQNRKVKVSLPMAQKIILVDPEEILYCESEGSYTDIIMNNGDRYCISKNLKQLEQQLNQNFFLRVHQSFIINLQSISEYHRGDGGEVILQNGKNIPVSRSRKERLLELILK